MMRALLTNSSRSALVVLSLSIGVFAASLLLNTVSLLQPAFNRQYAAVVPSAATLIIPEGFNEDFVKSIRAMPGVQDAEGRHTVTVRLKAALNQWITLNLSAISDFDDIRIDKVLPF